jgi:hypothetical protein
MNLNNLIYNILLEQDFKANGKSKVLIDAIKQRHPVTFYYTGPKAPPKDAVLSGTRVRAQVVALGLSKKGNLIVRAWVQPPSTSKKGFKKHGWRTFMVNRMSSLRVLSDETFDNTGPGYKEGEESKAGPMSVTYVTTDWTKTPEPKAEPETRPLPTPEPVAKPEEKPKPEELPQPKTSEKPSPIPQPKDYSGDVYKKLQTTVKDVEGQKSITTQDYKTAYDELYGAKQKEWVDAQKQLGKNTSPGEGTRKRFDIETNNELSKLLSKDNIKVQDEEPNKDLAESIQRIKTLMLS